jgi:hypothetical protein
MESPGSETDGGDVDVVDGRAVGELPGVPADRGGANADVVAGGGCAGPRSHDGVATKGMLMGRA